MANMTRSYTAIVREKGPVSRFLAYGFGMCFLLLAPDDRCHDGGTINSTRGPLCFSPLQLIY